MLRVDAPQQLALVEPERQRVIRLPRPRLPGRLLTRQHNGQAIEIGTIRLGGKRPNNTSGGHQCEGYTHGMNMVIENVRQLRHDADDSCPVGPDGKRRHTYDYKEGGCRQVKNCEVTANLGWANPGTGSAMVMRRD